MPPTRKRPFRFVFTGKNDGFTNMAMDEAVMSGLKNGWSTPMLRIYQWNPPTISIGYFQRKDDIAFDKCRKDGIGVVRRLTGGRAVLHFHELTYSILFTEQDFTPFKKKDIFLFIARCLVEALNLMGIPSKIAEKTRGDLKSANCFASPAQFEIESIKEGKLIGSAQTIKDGVVLQHGAIPLLNSYTRIGDYLKNTKISFKNISSLGQLAADINESRLLHFLRQGFSTFLPLKDQGLNQYEKHQTKKLYRKYAGEEWMFRK